MLGHHQRGPVSVENLHGPMATFYLATRRLRWLRCCLKALRSPLEDVDMQCQGCYSQCCDLQRWRSGALAAQDRWSRQRPPWGFSLVRPVRDVRVAGLWGVQVRGRCSHAAERKLHHLPGVGLGRLWQHLCGRRGRQSWKIS